MTHIPWPRPFRLPRLKPASDALLHLDVIRFIASAGIVYHHSHEFFIVPANRDMVMAGTSGLALFVDLFFVISGFVIAYIYRDRVGTLREFLKFMQRRIGRLLPLHWLTLAISVAIFALAALLGAAPDHGPSFRPACIADTALLLHGIVPCGTTYFNGVTWSISVEMCMYVLFPVFAAVAACWRGGPMIVGIGIFAVIAAHAWAIGSFLTYRWDEQMPLLRVLPSFLIGIGLWQHRKWLCYVPVAPQILMLSMLATIGAMLSGAPTLMILFLIYVSAAAAVAADLQRRAGNFVRRLAPLGQLTYSIYMWHGLFILILMNVLGDKLLHGATIPLALLTILCYIGILVWSYISFEFIETPARQWIDRLSPARFRSFRLAKLGR